MLGVGGRAVAGWTGEDVNQLERDCRGAVRLEVLGGAAGRAGGVRASLPSPCFSSLSRRLRGREAGPGRQQGSQASLHHREQRTKVGGFRPGC